MSDWNPGDAIRPLWPNVSVETASASGKTFRGREVTVVAKKGAGSAGQPATASDHSRRAQELIDEARQVAASGTNDAAARYAQKITEAQVHATLALAAGPAPRSFWYGWLVLVFAGFFAWLSIFGYNRFSHYYPAVTVAGSTHNLGALQDVTMSAANGSLAWTQQGFVQQLDVTGPAEGTAEVTLPLPAAQCPLMAKALGTTCQDGNALTIGNPVRFSWQSPQEVSSDGGSPANSTGLTIAAALGTPGALGITMLTQTTSVPTACFDAPATGAVLKVTSGGSTYRYPNGPGQSWQEACAAVPSSAGITVSVTLPGPGLRNGRPPTFEYGGISTLAVCAAGSDGTLQGFTGQLDLVPGGTTVLGTPATVLLRAKPLLVSLDVGPNSELSAPTPCSAGPAPSSAVCDIPASANSLALCTAAATGVITSSGQLVPSAWDRYSAVTVPIFGGLVTALVVAPLGVSVQVLMDAMKRWRLPSPFRRRRGRGTTKDTNHAP
jgi:hypothetical protein